MSQISVDNSYITGSMGGGGIVGAAMNNNYLKLSRVSARGGVYGGFVAGGILGGAFFGKVVIYDAYFAGASSLAFLPPSDYGSTAGFVYSGDGGLAGGIVGIAPKKATIKRVYLGDDVVVAADLTAAGIHGGLGHFQ